ncbi:MAG TPA: diguanylate cyclase [Thermoanaerobaculia bacterium]|nr:diguanylate cyclase [Thermoanaerobaculia bacterium]
MDANPEKSAPSAAIDSRQLTAGLLAVLFALVLIGQAVSLTISSGRRIGVDIESGRGQLVIEQIEPGLPADLAGVQAGDTIIALNGTPVSTVRSYDQAVKRLAPYQSFRLTILHRGAQRTLTVEAGAPFPWLDFSMGALTAIAYFILGLVVLRRARDDRRALLLAVFSFAVAVEMALPDLSIGTPILTSIVWVLTYLLNGLQFSTEMHLAVVIPEPRPWLERNRWLVPLFYIIGGALGVVGAVTVVAATGPNNPMPWTSFAMQSALDNVFLPLWAVLVVAFLAEAAAHASSLEGRRQAALVLVGVLPWAVLMVWISLAQYFGQPVADWVDRFQPLALLAYPVAVFFAIFAYGLFDLRLVLRRSLIYSGLTWSLLLVFYATIGAGGALLSNWIEDGESSLIVIAIASLAVGLLFAPFRRSLQRLIDRRFFPERNALRRRLTELAGELPARGQLPSMAQHLIESVVEIFALRGATLLITEPSSGVVMSLASHGSTRRPSSERPFLVPLDDPGVEFLRQSHSAVAERAISARNSSLGQRMVELGAVVATPLLAHNKLVGALLIGPKVSGVQPNAEEIELLQLLSRHAATVFENVRLFQSATYEGLTGLLRREAILEKLDLELRRALRYHRPLTVGIADLDRFKQVNDRFGHLAGDLVLKRVAQTLSSSLRTSDLLGRLGGEEFLFLLPETDLVDSMPVAEKLRFAVENLCVELDEGEVVEVTISIGLASVSELPAEPPATASDLMAAADRSLYRAKTTGRNRIEPQTAAIA